MTIPEFKVAISDNSPGIGSPNTKVITLFNTSSATTSTIDAIAIRIGDTTVKELREATELTLQLPNVAEYLHVSLVSSTYPPRTVDTSIAYSYFVYEFYPPSQRRVITTPTTGSDGYQEGSVNYLLEPTGTTIRSSISDYSVLIGTVGESRESTYIVKADRSSIRTTGSLLNPINIGNIVNNTAEPADVQDSNYRSTPWRNSRYEGSKLATTNNGNIDPFIQGNFIEGAYFSKNSSDSYIKTLASGGNIEYTPYFSTGKLTIPRYVVEDLNLKLYGTAATSTTTSLQLSSSTSPFNKQLVLGDLLIFSGSSGYSTEALRLSTPTGSTYTPYEFLSRTSTKETARILTLRGYSSTKRVAIPLGSACYRIVGTKLYNIVGSSILASKEGKIIIKGMDEVLYISTDGLVISGSARVAYEDL